MPTATRKALQRNVEWEFDDHLIPRGMSRNLVTRFLVELAEDGGWELARVRITPDGQHRVVVRRKIIRQLRPQFYYVA
jgi:hypothetical protein